MTALNIGTDIPTNINTLERLAAWVGLALRRVNPTLAVVEVPEASPEKVAQAAVVQADDGSTRLFIRLSIKFDPAYSEDNTIKLWEHAQEFSNTELPAAFKSN